MSVWFDLTWGKQVLKAKEAKKAAPAAPAGKKDKFVGNAATAKVS